MVNFNSVTAKIVGEALTSELGFEYVCTYTILCCLGREVMSKLRLMVVELMKTNINLVS